MIGDSYIKQSELFQIIESNEKFEDLLVTNNLFVDYFNAFLLNPGLSEKLKFNFVSGDLELIENEENRDKAPLRRDRQDEAALSKAVVVKKKLETQLKSIIKTHSAKNASRINSRLNEPSKISFKEVENPRSRKDELLKQVGNHSFKDIQLIEIDPLNRSQRDTSQEVPVLDTTYKVNVLKKPFSMKWLYYRRLSLFLQSELYNEFKLGMILHQCQLLNNQHNKAENKLIKFIKIEIDKELIEMNFNPFEAKNDYERLQKFYEENKNESEISVKELNLPAIFNENKNEEIKKVEKEAAIINHKPIETEVDKIAMTASKLKSIVKKEKKNTSEKKQLIQAGVEMYESLKEERSKTSLLTIKSNESQSGRLKNKIEDNEQDLNAIKTIETLDDLAKELVTNVITNSLDQFRNSTVSVQSHNDSHRRSKVITRESTMSQLSINKTNSRLGYYKDFQNDIDLKQSFDINNSDLDDDNDEDINDKIVLELEDEPEVDDLMYSRSEIENFKIFLKENDGFLYYKLWIDIEKLNTMMNANEKNIHLKQIKFEYNRPQIYNRLNRETFSNSNSAEKKNKYELLYEQYEKNIDFWSLEYLTKTLHPKVLNFLIYYWWPKYQIKLTDFNNYMTNKYPSYSNQKKVIDSQKVLANDLEVQNIEKSVKVTEKMNSDKDSDKSSLKSLKSVTKSKKPITKKIVVEPPRTAKTSVKSSAVFTEVNSSAKKRPTGLEGYDLDEFLTSPPVGWKRPASTATVMIKKMIDNKQSKKPDDEVKRKSLDKEIYLEAVYNDDVAGQIFKKYLISRNKSFAINRLKCLQELMKYKDLFFDQENFNQENAKAFAFEIYRKYIAVSALISIDCPKADRLHLHSLFADPNFSTKTVIGVNTSSSSNRPPVYEDTFNSVEEYLINILYDDWKVFFDTEKSFFNHNEIENIERTINIKSKQIDELLNKGLVRMNSAHSMKNASRTSASEANSFVYSSKDLNSSSQQPTMNLKEIVNSREFEMFKMFLQSKNALVDILFWQDLEAYGQIDPLEENQIEAHAKMLKLKYLNKKYFFNKNGPIDEENQNIILEKIGGWNKVLEEKPSNTLIKLAKKQIENKLKFVWLPSYYNSEFKTKSKYNQRTLMQDVVDDVIFLKNTPKSNNQSSLITNRWLYTSNKVINFGKSLRNSFTTKLFSKYLSYKMYTNPNHGKFNWDNENNNLVNNLQFLVDVQEYKDLCQRNPDDERSIIFKMNHIIDCYINNRILPKIRIDISKELAEEILYQKDYLSPYLFMQANMRIFNYLMPYWIDFNQMRHDSDIDILDEFRTFKKLKDYKPNKRATSAESIKDETINILSDHSIKWRYNQYVKALNTQLLL